MIEGQIKQLADEHAEKLIKHKMANHDIFVKEEAKKEIISVYTAGAKKATKICNDYYQNELDNLYKDYAKRLDELREENGQAKEIIKNLLSAYTSYADSFDDRDNGIVAEAEQFLKE